MKNFCVTFFKIYIPIIFIVLGSAMVIKQAYIDTLPEENVGGVTQEIVIKDTQYFAEIAEDGSVLRVIVATQDFIDSGVIRGTWIPTTKHNEPKKPSAGIGDKYDKTLDAFISPKPTSDATFDEVNVKWVIPEKPKEPIVISATST